jgi:ribonuclease HI
VGTFSLSEKASLDKDAIGVLTKSGPTVVGTSVPAFDANLQAQQPFLKLKVPTHVVCYFDGSCEPINPGGTAAFGSRILNSETQSVLVEVSELIGAGQGMSNNVAEYAGLCWLLEWLIAHPEVEGATICGDSNLVIQQMSGNWKAKKGLYLPWYQKAVTLNARLPHKVKFSWICREMNSEADSLSRQYVKQF